MAQSTDILFEIGPFAINLTSAYHWFGLSSEQLTATVKVLRDLSMKLLDEARLREPDKFEQLATVSGLIWLPKTTIARLRALPPEEFAKIVGGWLQ